MIAICTAIHASTTAPAVNALARAMRVRAMTATAASRNDPPTTTKRTRLGIV